MCNEIMFQETQYAENQLKVNKSRKKNGGYGVLFGSVLIVVENCANRACFPCEIHQIEFLACVCFRNEMVNGCNGCDHNLPYKSIILVFHVFYPSILVVVLLLLSFCRSISPYIGYFVAPKSTTHAHNFEIKRKVVINDHSP